MKIWKQNDPFADSPLREYFREQDKVYSYAMEKATEEECLIDMEFPSDEPLLLKCYQLVRERRQKGCHHHFSHADFLDVEYIRDGNLFFRQDGHCYLAEKGDICLLRPGTVSDIITGPAGFCFKASLSIRGALLPAILEALHLDKMDIVTLSDGGGRLESLFEQFAQTLPRRTVFSREHLAGLCLELLEIIVHHNFPSEDNPELVPITACMEKHLREGVSIPDIARELGMSSATLIRRCRQTANLSPGQLMTRLRMHRAATMLLDNRRRIKEIAYELGYDNALNFSTKFRGFFGVSPRQYRRQHLLFGEKKNGADIAILPPHH